MSDVPSIFREVIGEAERGQWPVNIITTRAGLTLHGIPYDGDGYLAVSDYARDGDGWYVPSDVQPMWLRWDAVIGVQHAEHDPARAWRA